LPASAVLIALGHSDSVILLDPVIGGILVRNHAAVVRPAPRNGRALGTFLWRLRWRIALLVDLVLRLVQRAIMPRLPRLRRRGLLLFIDLPVRLVQRTVVP
jgi:hypothetical protein